jgi:hypothetical protein
MLLIDDILLSPMRGIFWIFREIYNATLEETTHEADTITMKLSELYMMLETGSISEQEFDVMEKELLDRLEAIREPGALSDDYNGEDDDLPAVENDRMSVNEIE